MNVFTLFEDKDIENIKLGLQVVKSLNLQKDFEEYFERPFDNYELVFNYFVVYAKANNNRNSIKLVYIVEKLLFDFRKLEQWEVSQVINNHSELIGCLYLEKLEEYHITYILCSHPQYIDKLDLSSMSEPNIRYVLSKQPQLNPYFNK